MPYQLILGEQLQNLFPKVAKHSFSEKRLHEESKKLISEEVEKIANDPTKFNGEKALFYFKNSSLPDSNILKIVSEDYASVLASSKVKREVQPGSDQYLRPQFAAGVIVVCKTSDGKIIIGSRDANRSKTDSTTYPLQFPCGFIDVDEDFYEGLRSNNTTSQLLQEKIVGDGLRELREEVINFGAEQISNANLISAIYETKQWPQKEEKGGGTKDVNVIKSFIVAVDVTLTYAEIEEARNQQILNLNEMLKETPDNEELRRQKKDFDEMTQMTCVEISQIPEILTTAANVGTAVEINFDGKNRKFVAEHGETLNALAETLFRQQTTPNTSPSSTTAETVIPQNRSAETLV